LTLILRRPHLQDEYGEMLECHRHYQADITIATLQVAPEEAAVCIAEIDAATVSWASKRNRSTATQALEFQSRMVSASMGIYVFDTDVLLRALHEDAEDTTRVTIRPRRAARLLSRRRVIAYDFRDMNASRCATGATWEPRRLLRCQHGPVDVEPLFNLYDRAGPSAPT